MMRTALSRVGGLCAIPFGFGIIGNILIELATQLPGQRPGPAVSNAGLVHLHHRHDALAGTGDKHLVGLQQLSQADIPDLVGSNQRLCEATGWQPELQLRQTLHDLLDWWRARV